MSSFDTPQDWLNQAQKLCEAGDYAAAITTYEAAIVAHPMARQLYWHYGVALLLCDQVDEAEGTWLMVLAEAEDEALWLGELQQVLQGAIAMQTQQGKLSNVRSLRQCLLQLQPEDSENLLHWLVIAVETQSLTLDLLLDYQVADRLAASDLEKVPQSLLLCALDRYLSVAFPHAVTPEITAAIAPHITNVAELADLVLAHGRRIAYSQRYPQLAQDLLQIILARSPQHFELLLASSGFSQQEHQYGDAIAQAQRAVAVATSPVETLASMNSLLRCYLASGQRDAAFLQLCHQYVELLRTFPVECDFTRQDAYRLLVAGICLPYLDDQPQLYRGLQNRMVALAQEAFQRIHQPLYARYQASHAQRSRSSQPQRLKVGYVCQYFYQHSVGWLARWLLQNHDPEQIDLCIYIVNPQANPDTVQQQYQQMAAQVRLCPLDALAIAEQIHQDQLDILVELDSLTCEVTCEVMALRPAPIQVSWLGWDASGLSTIDYFMADHDVLPETAQANYPEKIVRLPQSYIAIGGFEVGVPTLPRSQLGIPDTAVVYLTAQRGYKRHPEMMRSQLQILQQVPGSYLLIKGLADQTAIQTEFLTLAADMGIPGDRLVFLPMVQSEAIHRANLSIADVVLDTYPYNGATTTLEALWMERPLVTQVGEQFAARNSYTMLKHAGIDAGIAFNAAEYIEWGVRLGLDTSLRQQVAWQLRRSKQTAPLWDVQQFAQDVEAAYRQMWRESVAGIKAQ